MSHTPKVQLIKASQTPQTTIGIALDTAYLTSLPPGTQPSTGIYMIDNRLNIGSYNEGQMELYTLCYPGDNVSFYAQPIDTQRGDSVSIIGINVSYGNVFGGSLGAPQPTDNAAYWIGRAINSGRQTYQVQVLITDENHNVYVINWDPFIQTVGS
jgi:hypothetical protein